MVQSIRAFLRHLTYLLLAGAACFRILAEGLPEGIERLRDLDFDLLKGSSIVSAVWGGVAKQVIFYFWLRAGWAHGDVKSSGQLDAKHGFGWD